MDDGGYYGIQLLPVLLIFGSVCDRQRLPGVTPWKECPDLGHSLVDTAGELRVLHLCRLSGGVLHR